MGKKMRGKEEVGVSLTFSYVTLIFKFKGGAISVWETSWI